MEIADCMSRNPKPTEPRTAESAPETINKEYEMLMVQLNLKEEEDEDKTFSGLYEISFSRASANPKEGGGRIPSSTQKAETEPVPCHAFKGGSGIESARRYDSNSGRQSQKW